MVAVLALGVYAQGLRKDVWGVHLGCFEADVFRGVVDVTWYRFSEPDKPWFRLQHGRAGPATDGFPFYMWPPRVHWDDRWVEAIIPLWMYVVVAGAVSALAWRRWLRWCPPDACRKCRYDLSGLSAVALCPECGAGSLRNKMNGNA